MQAATVEVLALFDRDIRYLVPIFQRNYRWTKDEHWAPLWADVQKVAEDLLDVDEGVDAADHFLGAIVCEQIPAYGRDAHAVQVIDGQQRLTTLQLLLAVVRRVAAKRGMADADYVAGFIENKPAVVRNRPEHLYKVWPNIADRPAYMAAMADGQGRDGLEGAVQFFEAAIDRWLEVGVEDDPLDDAENTAEERLEALISAVMRCVKVVKIDLEANDNAQVIFETLNARGARLTDADLIRNHLFRLADEQELDAVSLHSKHWSRFEENEWKTNIAHGRHSRERLELFLNYWLSMRRRQDVAGSAIFRHFKEFAVGKSALDIAADIDTSAQVFGSFDRQPHDTPEWWFFRRLGEMDLITVYPVLLWLLGQHPADLEISSRRRAMKAIESYLGRRLVGRYTTRGYGDLFMQVLKRVIDGPVADADRSVIQLLGEKSAETDRWPSDDEFRSLVLNTNAYRIKGSRLRMILEAADRQMADDGRTESITLGHNLWIEHLLPQTWRGTAGWSLPGEAVDVEASAQRDHVLHTLGNLTLTTSKLDIELSNRPWADKLGQIGASSSLALNREIITRYPSHWDEDAIRDRGTRLATALGQVWPSADALLNSSN